MKKKVIGMVLSLSMIIGLCGCGSTGTDTTVSSNNTQQESTTNEDGMSNEDEKEESKGENPDVAPVSAFDYNVMSDGTIELTGYSARNEYKVIEIPEEIDGYTVTALGFVEEEDDDDALRGFGGGDDVVEKIIIPDTVTVVGGYSFACCSNLKSIQLGSGVKEIHGFAFYVSGLENVEIPNGVTKIEDGAFATSLSLVEVTLPGSVSTIGELAFGACSDELTIKAPAGSVGETFANERGLNFEAQ